jgi:ubiquitin fusion degradation protein 1
MHTSALGSTMNMRFAQSSWLGAKRQAAFEQKVEDCNANYRVNNILMQRLIVLPLDNNFIPSKYNNLYGKIEHSDKCCFPKSIGSELLGKPYDFPWIFEVTAVGRSGQLKEVQKKDRQTTTSSQAQPIPADSASASADSVKKAYVSTLDFRSPENYIFVPRWVMETLDLDRYDQVDVKFVRMKPASLVTLQPLSSNWFSFVEKYASAVTSILENEINKYSTLTAGSIIAIKYKDVKYVLRVNKTTSEGDVSVWGVRIQDSDVKIEIDTTSLLKSSIL